jgi:hypothetical protein
MHLRAVRRQAARHGVAQPAARAVLSVTRPVRMWLCIVRLSIGGGSLDLGR